jgi:hypothetical protein
MATLEDYSTGKAFEDMKTASDIALEMDDEMIESGSADRFFELVGTVEPKTINIEEAAEFVNNSGKCASGERACKALHEGSVHTESVWLDGLAEEMVKIGKAVYVSKEEAIETLKKYPENPLLMTKIEGKYMEICRSNPDKCVFWLTEKKAGNCILR